MFSWFTFFLVFSAYFLVDVLYAYYTVKVVQGKPFLSASAAAGIASFSAFGVLSYIENPWYVVAIVLGSYAGTYIVVKYQPVH